MSTHPFSLFPPLNSPLTPDLTHQQFEFINQLSADPSNLFIGLVRDKATTEQKVATELGSRPNVHIVSADLDSYASLQNAVEETSKIVGERGIDYFVSNGAYLPEWDGWHNVSALYVHPPPFSPLYPLVVDLGCEYEV